MKKLLLGTAIAALSSTAFANDYQFEIGAGYLGGEALNTDFDGFNVFGTVHFDQVDTSKGPYREASFLDKSSFVTLNVVNTEADFSGADDNTDVTALGRFVFNNFIVEASYTDFDIDESAYSIGFGGYITDEVDVVVSYQGFDEADAETWAADFHGVSEGDGDSSVGWHIGVAHTDNDDIDDDYVTIVAGADYYFNKSLSAGASFAQTNASGDNDFIANFRVDYFITPAFRTFVSYSDTRDDLDSHAYTLGGAFRF